MRFRFGRFVLGALLAALVVLMPYGLYFVLGGVWDEPARAALSFLVAFCALVAVAIGFTD